MSERLTSIKLPGVFGSGIADYGRKTAPEMIAQLRRYAENQRAVAEAILAADDDDFCVTTYLGVHVQRQRETIQIGRAAGAPFPFPGKRFSPNT